MATLYENIIALCQSRGIKGGKMCTDIGISKSTMTELKMGRKKGLSAEYAQKIASYFGVTVGYLLGEEDKPTAQGDGLSEKKQELINCIKALPDDNILTLLQIARMMDLINCTKALPENEILTLLRVVKSIR